MTGSEYALGTRYVVAVAGCRLVGLDPRPGGYADWRRDLEEGEVLTCLGTSPSLGEGPDLLKWQAVGASGDPVVDCEFVPASGDRGVPAPGCVEREGRPANG